MTYRKTWFSYVLWALYTVLCVILLVVFVGGVWTSYLAGTPYAQGFPAPVISPLAGLSDDLQFLIWLFMLPITVLLYFVLRGISQAVRRKHRWKEETLRIWECVTVLLILAGGVTLRVLYAQYVISMADHELFLEAQVSGMEYYNMAVAAGRGPTTYYGLNRISYLYVLCLAVAVSFLGHKIASAVIMQMILQIVGMLLAYVVTRRSAGRLPACIVLLYLSCSISCLRMLICFGPEWLFFVLYMIGMLIVVTFMRRYCEKCRHKTAAVIVTVVFVYVLILLGAAWFESPPGQFDFGKVQLWYRYGEGFINRKPYLYDIYLVGFLVIPASFLIFEFIRSGKEQNYMLWILFCLIAAPTPMAVIGSEQFGLLSLYIWAVLAGLGLQNCIFGGKAKVMQAVIEQINADADQTEAADEIGNSHKTEESNKSKECGRKEEAVVPEESKPQEQRLEEPKPRYIENPLPLPKKHVKKEMDYQYPVEEKDMKYDVEVSDHDDFDV